MPMSKETAALLNNPKLGWLTTPPGGFDEYEQAEDKVGFVKTIAKFSHQIRYSFTMNFQPQTKSPLDNDRTYSKVIELVQWYTVVIIGADTMEEDKESMNIRLVDRRAIITIRKDQTMKIILMAGDKPTFANYYPELIDDYEFLYMTNKSLARTIRKNFPSLDTFENWYLKYQGELAYVIQQLPRQEV